MTLVLQALQDNPYKMNLKRSNRTHHFYIRYTIQCGLEELRRAMAENELEHQQDGSFTSFLNNFVPTRLQPTFTKSVLEDRSIRLSDGSFRFWGGGVETDDPATTLKALRRLKSTANLD